LNFPGKDGNPEYREGVFVGYRYYDTTKTKVLFPFGHGLSYTTFSYSDIKLSADSIKDTEKVTVSLKVTNTGAVAGREVVQLYVRDVESAVMRPDKELKGFSKVLLQPGETKEVSFELGYRSFAYYETKIHDFYVESGDFEILVGTSSTDILLSTKVYVEGTVELPVVFDMNSTVGEILATKKGRKVIEPILQRLQNYNSEQNLEALGEDTKEMEQAMALETPLSAMNCMGGIPMEEVEEILKELNR
jgi:beta-glucosidase